MHVVWFSEIKWDYLRTRKQQLICRRPSDIDVLFLEPYVRGRRNDFQLRRVDGISVATVPFVKSVPGGLFRVALDVPWIRGLVDREASRRVRTLLGRSGFDTGRETFVISNVYAVDVAAALPHDILVYDCNDAHSAFPGMPRWTRAYQKRTCRLADKVIASSDALRDDVTQIRGNDTDVELLGNGVDYERFARVASAAPHRARARPVIGYLGAIAPWLDFEAIEHVARAHPEWDIVLVGPVIGGADSIIGRLAQLANVSVRPAVSYDEVPGVISQFTVGIIPKFSSELTRAMNPNKMYEYLACGVPVVATAFSPEVSRYPEVVTAVRDVEAFERACAAFVAVDETVAARLRDAADRIAAANDWDVIAAAFWSNLSARP